MIVIHNNVPNSLHPSLHNMPPGPILRAGRGWGEKESKVKIDCDEDDWEFLDISGKNKMSCVFTVKAWQRSLMKWNSRSTHVQPHSPTCSGIYQWDHMSNVIIYSSNDFPVLLQSVSYYLPSCASVILLSVVGIWSSISRYMINVIHWVDFWNDQFIRYSYIVSSSTLFINSSSPWGTGSFGAQQWHAHGSSLSYYSGYRTYLPS